MTQTYEIEHLHQPNGWLSPGYLTVNDDGVIESVRVRCPEDALLVDWVVFVKIATRLPRTNRVGAAEWFGVKHKTSDVADGPTDFSVGAPKSDMSGLKVVVSAATGDYFF